jgi:outer membrane protein TolC
MLHRSTSSSARLARLAIGLGIVMVGSAATSAPATPVATQAAAPDIDLGLAPAERITFEEAVKRALARNPTIAVALAEIERADALVQEARAGWFPTLVGNGSFTVLDGNRRASPGGPIVDRWYQPYGNLTLTVPLVAPQGWTAESQAKDARRVAETSAVDVRRLIAQATGNAFLAVIAQRLQIHSNDTAIANAKDHATYAHTRLMGGIGRSIDDVRAQQDLATLLVQRQTFLTGLARAREALGVLVGGAEPVDAIETLDLGAMPSLASALEEAGTRRSDITSERAKVTAATNLRQNVWAYYSPYLAAVGQPFAQSGQAILPTWGWQAELLLTLPLYDGGTRGGLKRERDDELVEARTNLDATLRQARSEVRLSFESMLRADQALAAARDAATLAKQAYELAVVAYKAGATTNIEVLDAARQARDADSAAAAASDIARRARLDLLVASGRFP